MHNGRHNQSCRECNIWRAKQREQTAVSYKGDNFRFVTWGGLADLKLWTAR
jgi:hypothetical protein